MCILPVAAGAPTARLGRVNGAEQVQQWSVPGRVNLVGEHLDYNGGASLPIAIDKGFTVKVRPRPDETVNVWSAGQKASFPVGVQPGDVDGWAAYVAGTVWAAREAGHRVGGVDLVLDSDLPSGAGLSSSAALTCGVAVSLDSLGGWQQGPTDLAVLARRAENDFVGAPTGLMDQLAVMHGRRGHAVRVDAATEPPAVEVVPIDWESAGLVLAVIATGVNHSHADGGYADRHAESRRAAEALGVEHLAQVGLDALVTLEDETLKARTRHVLTENARVKAFVRAAADGSWVQAGTILTASHASLRDDYQVSAAELDVAVDTALEAGALGARMTGGGFGGSAIALVERDRAVDMARAVEAAFEHMSWKKPQVFPVSPADGARRTA